MMTEHALEKVCEFVKDNLAYAMYEANGVWMRSELVLIEVKDDGTIAASFDITVSAESTHITAVRLYDANDEIWNEQSVSISRAATNENLYVSVRIRVYAE